MLLISFFDTKHLISGEIINGVVFIRSGFIFALKWNRKSVFVFDFHTQDKNGCYTLNKRPVFVKVRSVEIFIYLIIKKFGAVIEVGFCRMMLDALRLNYLAQILKAFFWQLSTTNKWINNRHSYSKANIRRYNQNTSLIKTKCLEK